MWNRLSATNDQYLKERLHDLRDVADRLQNYLSGDYCRACEVVNSRDIVVVAQTMGPADLMDYDYNKIRGLIIEDGTPTMHVAIVAKALNIPVIAKSKACLTILKPGTIWRLTATKVMFISIRTKACWKNSAPKLPKSKSCWPVWPS